MDFPQEVLLPPKTIFRKDSALEIAAESLEFGSRGLIVHGNSLNKNGKKEEILNKFPPLAQVESFCRDGGEPILDEITQVIMKAKAVRAEWIVGIGGGSVLDLAKAAAGLFNAKEKPNIIRKEENLKKEAFLLLPSPQPLEPAQRLLQTL